MVYKLRWSDESVKNLEDILEDIKFKWTDKEVDNFKIKLSHQLDLIIHNPYLFPARKRNYFRQYAKPKTDYSDNGSPN